MTTVPFTEEAVRDYLDGNIRAWRNWRRTPDDPRRGMAMYYVDAYQSVRASLFGEILPEEKDDDTDDTVGGIRRRPPSLS
jgi:hypothetical protein